MNFNLVLGLPFLKRPIQLGNRNYTQLQSLSFDGTINKVHEKNYKTNNEINTMYHVFFSFTIMSIFAIILPEEYNLYNR